MLPRREAAFPHGEGVRAQRALTDEGNQALPMNRPVLTVRGPLHTRRCGGTLSMQEKAEDFFIMR